MRIAILLLAATLLSLSCEKKKSFCWECRTIVSYMGEVAESKTNVCDMTTEQIRDLEKEGTYSTTATAGGVTATTKSTTVCSQR